MALRRLQGLTAQRRLLEQRLPAVREDAVWPVLDEHFTTLYGYAERLAGRDAAEDLLTVALAEIRRERSDDPDLLQVLASIRRAAPPRPLQSVNWFDGIRNLTSAEGELLFLRLVVGLSLKDAAFVLGRPVERLRRLQLLALSRVTAAQPAR